VGQVAARVGYLIPRPICNANSAYVLASNVTLVHRLPQVAADGESGLIRGQSPDVQGVPDHSGDDILRSALSAAHAQNARLRGSLAAMRQAMETLPGPAASPQPQHIADNQESDKAGDAVEEADALHERAAEVSCAAVASVSGHGDEALAWELQNLREQVAALTSERDRLTDVASERARSGTGAQPGGPQQQAAPAGLEVSCRAADSLGVEIAGGDRSADVGDADGNTDDVGNNDIQAAAAERIEQLEEENEKLMELNSALRAEHDDLLTVAWGGSASAVRRGLLPPPPPHGDRMALWHQQYNQHGGWQMVAGRPGTDAFQRGMDSCSSTAAPQAPEACGMLPWYVSVQESHEAGAAMAAGLVDWTHGMFQSLSMHTCSSFSPLYDVHTNVTLRTDWSDVGRHRMDSNRPSHFSGVRMSD
jgi:hypothetical protein